MDLSDLNKSYTNVKKVKDSLIENINYFDQLETGFSFKDTFWQNVIEDMEASAMKTEEKYEALNVYFGNLENKEGKLDKRAVPSKGKRDKRDLESLASGALVFGANVYTSHVTNKDRSKIEQFLTTYDEKVNPIRTKVSQLTNFTQDQMTQNNLFKTTLHKLDEKTETLNKTLNRLSYGHQSKIGLTYKISYVKDLYRSFSGTIDTIMKGLIEASKGVAQPPFLDVLKVRNVLREYNEKEKHEKSFWNEKDMINVFNMAKTRVEKHNDVVYVISEIRLPTVVSTFNLLRLITYPVYNHSQEAFVKLNPSSQYLAVNDESQYVVLSSSDLNRCENTGNFFLCQEHQLVQSESEPSCEAGIWFNKTQDVELLCDYSFEKKDFAKLVHIEQGVYHFSVKTPTKVPIDCYRNGIESFHLKTIENSGFLVVDDQCTATVESETLKNLKSDVLDDYEIIPDNSHHDIEEIFDIKLNASMKDKTNDLTNEEVVGRIEEENRRKAANVEIEDLYQDLQDVDKSAKKALETFKRGNVKKQKRLDSSVASNKAAVNLVEALLFVFGIALLIVIVGFCTFLKLMKK